MKKFFKIGCLGFIAIMVLLVVIGYVIGDKDSTNTADNSTPAAANAAEKKDTPKKEEAKKLAKIGEELQIGDVVFKVNKISTTKKIKDGEYLSYSPKADGSTFLVANVTVKNAGKKMITTDSSYFKLMKDEIAYNPSNIITTSGDYFLYSGINPGLAQTGNVVFEVPEGMAEFLLNVQTGFWGTEQGQIELK